MTNFKVGDKVKYVGHCEGWNGRLATVAEANRIAELGGAFDLIIEDGKGKELLVAADELVLAPAKFKVGDWVKVHGRNDKYDGTVGTISKVRIDPYGTGVNLYNIHKDGNAGQDWNFFEDQLKAHTPALFSKSDTYGLSAKDEAWAQANKKSSKFDNVDGPAHYGGKDNPFEVIKVAEAWGFEKNAYLFNALKYLARAGKKGNKVEDLKKLQYYVAREIALEEAKK